MQHRNYALRPLATKAGGKPLTLGALRTLLLSASMDF